MIKWILLALAVGTILGFLLPPLHFRWPAVDANAPIIVPVIVYDD